MDYKAAKLRLDTPKKQESKKLGHELRLSYTFTQGAGGPPRIDLTYFKTNIITWYEDDRIYIRTGGYIHSQCTRQKINEYTPRGWRLDTHHLRFMPKKSVATLSKRDEKWNLLWAHPFTEDSSYCDAEGWRLGGSLYKEHNAFDTLSAVEETTVKSVRAFLNGECPPLLTPNDESLRYWEQATLIGEKNEFHLMEAVYRVAIAREASDDLMDMIAWCRMGSEQGECLNYFRDVYALTSPTVKSDRGLAAQMEYFMQMGQEHLRDKKNSPEYHELRRLILHNTQKYLLERLGFQVFSKD